MRIEGCTLEQLQTIGKKMGKRLRPGNTVILTGDVGVGKTTFTKSLAQGLGIDEPIQSPSFTIVNNYATATGTRLAHYDFYRLDEAGIMADELAETVGDTVVVIEWAEIVDGVLPADKLLVRFEAADETTRNLEFMASGERSRALLKGLTA